LALRHLQFSIKDPLKSETEQKMAFTRIDGYEIGSIRSNSCHPRQ
jgi:hypothetical protein